MARTSKAKTPTSEKIYFPLLREITIEQFRSLYDVRLALKPLNIFIGANASGKSNFFKLLRQTRQWLVRGAHADVQSETLPAFWYNNNNANKEFRVRLEVELPEQLSNQGVEYELSIALLEESQNAVFSSERVRFQPPDHEDTLDMIVRKGSKGKRYTYPDLEPSEIRGLRQVSVLNAFTNEETFPQIQDLFDFIRGWRIFSFFPEDIQKSVISSPQPTKIPRLNEKGRNLSEFLYALNLFNPDAFAEIEERLERSIRFPSAIETHYAPSIAGNGKAQLMFHEHPFGERPIPAESMSDGTLRLLALYAALIGDESSSLICLEEPDQGLHPRLMLRLADTLRAVVDISPEDAIAGANRPQILLTTHSTDLLDCFDLEREKAYLQVFVVERNEEDGKTDIRPVSADNLAHWLNEYRLGDLVRRGVIS